MTIFIMKSVNEKSATSRRCPSSSYGLQSLQLQPATCNLQPATYKIPLQ
jgi:hypothetical protein